MTPGDILANASRLVSAAYNELLQVAASLENSSYRRLMTECIAAPKVTFTFEKYPSEADRYKLFAEMVKLGFFNSQDSPEHVWPDGHMQPQSYLTAPSSHNDFYNAHPGGLAVTVAYNIRDGRSLHQQLPADVWCAYKIAICLRRLYVSTNIPRCGSTNGSPTGLGLRSRVPSMTILGTRTAFTLLQNLSPSPGCSIVMAMAAAHQLSALEASMDGHRVVCKWHGLDRVAHFIKAAAVMAQVDPVDYGLLESVKGRRWCWHHNQPNSG